jgi:hypothetical protein
VRCLHCPTDDSIAFSPGKRGNNLPSLMKAIMSTTSQSGVGSSHLRDHPICAREKEGNGCEGGLSATVFSVQRRRSGQAKKSRRPSAIPLLVLRVSYAELELALRPRHLWP